jgi:hypothetical protein
LLIINKTKHPTKGEKKVQDEKAQVLTNEESFKKKGQIVKGTKTNQVFNPLIVRSMSYKTRGRGPTI